MAKISRKEARENLFALLFETEFNIEGNPNEIFRLSCENREIPLDKYMKDTYFGIISRLNVLDAVIGKYSKSWKADRLSRVSRNILRIAVYEMLFVEDIPANVSISQAVELTLKYGEDKAKQFVNGVLSGLFKDTEKNGIDAIIADAAQTVANAEKAVDAEQASDGENEAVSDTTADGDENE